MKGRRQALADALGHARQILIRAGHGPATERQLTKTLMGASMNPAQAKLLTEGRLLQEIEPPRLGGAPGDSYPTPKVKRALKHDRAAEREAKTRERARAKELRSAERAADSAARVAREATKSARRHSERAAAAQRSAEGAEARARELHSVADQRRAEVEALRRVLAPTIGRSSPERSG
jgi:hypothetical protein